jgi:glycosyltransferase involved in cell wall biosynthesis
VTSIHVAVDLRLAGYRTGGISRYATELFKALQARDDLTVTALRSSADDTSPESSVRLRTPPHHRLERYSIAVELALARIRPDVYHATDFIAPRVPRVPIIATVHDLEFLRHPEFLDASALSYYRQIESSKKWTESWITPSQWTADDLMASFDIERRRITVVPQGIDRHLTLKPAIPRHERGRYILAVGTIEPRKRYDLLLTAHRLMNEPPRLEVVGNPGWESEGVSTRLSNTAGVNWRAGESDTSLWELYRNAFAVVVPSKSEGFGLSALEAMAAGTPVVSSGHGALPEVTGQAALIPASDDPPGWAAAIERIMEDEPLWNELSLFGQRRARELSWEHTAARTLAAYKHATKR